MLPTPRIGMVGAKQRQFGQSQRPENAGGGQIAAIGPYAKAGRRRIGGHVAAELQFDQVTGQGASPLQESRLTGGFVQLDGRIERIAAFERGAAVISVEVAGQPFMELRDHFGPVWPRGSGWIGDVAPHAPGDVQALAAMVGILVLQITGGHGLPDDHQVACRDGRVVRIDVAPLPADRHHDVIHEAAVRSDHVVEIAVSPPQFVGDLAAIPARVFEQAQLRKPYQAKRRAEHPLSQVARLMPAADQIDVLARVHPPRIVKMAGGVPTGEAVAAPLSGEIIEKHPQRLLERVAGNDDWPRAQPAAMNGV